MKRLARVSILSTIALTVLGGAPLTAADAAAPTPAVLSVGQISRQDVAPQPGSEPDTLVEPDVAVSPLNPRIAVAASHDGRFPDGGAVAISHAWTRDGGRTWRHAAVPFLTKAVGGAYDRASDPVLAFGPDGTAYLSTLLFDTNSCSGAVAVSRSTDGGATFEAPVFAHAGDSCDFSDDKNWIVVDTSKNSPHLGRIYQFWTAYTPDAQGNYTGAQVLRWSDDQAATWSDTVFLTEPGIDTQGSQPMIQRDGTIIDAYLTFGPGGSGEKPERVGGRPGRSAQAAKPLATPGDPFVARTSRDGGATWSSETTITTDIGPGPDGIRCCLPSAVADPTTGRLYAAWESVTPGLVRLSTSNDGRHWSAPIKVNRDPGRGYDHVNVDVTAFAGRAFVSYGTRNTRVAGGRYVQQQISASYNGGRSFGAPISVGGRSDLRYAAQAGGIFPGDYIGTAAGPGKVYAVWCRSSRPSDPSATYHQTLYAAVLRP
ncbi:MAG: sialidase family protein [Mycobacteriales bacterium]